MGGVYLFRPFEQLCCEHLQIAGPWKESRPGHHVCGFHTMNVGSPPCMGSSPCVRYQVSKYRGIQISRDPGIQVSRYPDIQSKTVNPEIDDLVVDKCLNSIFEFSVHRSTFVYLFNALTFQSVSI